MQSQTVFCTLLALSLSGSAAYAEPSVRTSGSSITVKEALTDEGLAQIMQALGSVKSPRFVLEKIGDEDLAKFCKSFPNAESLSVQTEKDRLRSIAPLAGIRKLTSLYLKAESVTDMSPLAGLTSLTLLTVNSKSMGPDLRWMSGLTKLKSVQLEAGSSLTSFEGFPALQGSPRVSISRAAPRDLSPLQNLPASRLELRYCTIQDLSPLTRMPSLQTLDLYGSTVKDFSPLAGCAKLKKFTYYAVKGADFSTLGRLKQVRELDGGLTKLGSIAFLADLPNLRVFDVFAEDVTDYSPLASSKVEKFRIWQMPAGDLAVIGRAVTLKELALWDVSEAGNSAALSGLTNLEKFEIGSGYNRSGGEAFNLACARGWSRLKELKLAKTKTENEAGLAACSSLEKITLNEVGKEGRPFSLAGLNKMSKLKNVVITDSRISDFDALAGCPALVSIDISKTAGVTSLAAIKALPGLKSLTVSRGAFPDAELAGFAAGVKIHQR